VCEWERAALSHRSERGPLLTLWPAQVGSVLVPACIPRELLHLEEMAVALGKWARVASVSVVQTPSKSRVC
jgi:hypothetical protein